MTGIWIDVWKFLRGKIELNKEGVTLLTLDTRLVMTPPIIYKDWIGIDLYITTITDDWSAVSDVFRELLKTEQKDVSMKNSAETKTKDNSQQDLIMKDVIVTPSLQIENSLRFSVERIKNHQHLYVWHWRR